MNWKKIGKGILFPPMWMLPVLTPVATALLIYGMSAMDENDPIRITSYVIAFYALTIICARVPQMIRFVKNFKQENKYTNRWFSDYQLRMNVTVGMNVLWNAAYGALQLGLGVYHRSMWFYSLAVYYACLAVMRFFLVRHTMRYEPGKERKRELIYYRRCGWVFLLLNIALFGMMFYMIHENRATQHNQITTITMAAYTFTTLTMAIINIFRYRKYNSPVVSAARTVSLTAACVSMLSLENTMLITFDGGKMTAQARQMFLALTGGAISIGIIVMAIYMIVRSSKQIKALEFENGKRANL